MHVDITAVRARGLALLHIADALTAALEVPGSRCTGQAVDGAAHLLAVPDSSGIISLLVSPDAVVVAGGEHDAMPVDGMAAVLARAAVADLAHAGRVALDVGPLTELEIAGRAAYSAGSMRAPALSPLVREAIAGKAVGDPAVAAAMNAYTRGFDRAADEAAAA